jgi:hypothetical protein
MEEEDENVAMRMIEPVLDQVKHATCPRIIDKES